VRRRRRRRRRRERAKKKKKKTKKKSACAGEAARSGLGITMMMMRRVSSNGVRRGEQLRIVTEGFARGDRKLALERWTTPKRLRRTCCPRYGPQSRRGKPAGVAKRPRELLSHPKPSLPFRFATFFAYGVGQCGREERKRKPAPRLALVSPVARGRRWERRVSVALRGRRA
jgi:hypothetical protein